VPPGVQVAYHSHEIPSLQCMYAVTAVTATVTVTEPLNVAPGVQVAYHSHEIPGLQCTYANPPVQVGARHWECHGRHSQPLPQRLNGAGEGVSGGKGGSWATPGIPGGPLGFPGPTTS